MFKRKFNFILKRKIVCIDTCVAGCAHTEDSVPCSRQQFSSHIHVSYHPAHSKWGRPLQ